ncbi:hypothetical protein C0Q70_13772 [Pomacea canaliculata]|uniref:Uncharacterized protein n=1 Tax=Pomacea canaliculata TaxID=400727 RepID=A0A2T7NY69_POMCA|nr:hypothetical protein C0Q70_13772 [Pomacea canaliculata]
MLPTVPKDFSFSDAVLFLGSCSCSVACAGNAKSRDRERRCAALMSGRLGSAADSANERIVGGLSLSPCTSGFPSWQGREATHFSLPVSMAIRTKGSCVKDLTAAFPGHVQENFPREAPGVRLAVYLRCLAVLSFLNSVVHTRLHTLQHCSNNSCVTTAHTPPPARTSIQKRRRGSASQSFRHHNRPVLMTGIDVGRPAEILEALHMLLDIERVWFNQSREIRRFRSQRSTRSCIGEQDTRACYPTWGIISRVGLYPCAQAEITTHYSPQLFDHRQER